MARKIEQLLRVMADFQQFTDPEQMQEAFDDELSVTDLDFVAAAAQEPNTEKEDIQNLFRTH